MVVCLTLCKIVKFRLVDNLVLFFFQLEIYANKCKNGLSFCERLHYGLHLSVCSVLAINLGTKDSRKTKNVLAVGL